MNNLSRYIKAKAPSSGGSTSGWTRNPDWLELPELSAGDNRAVGLFAVYEDNPTNSLRVQISNGPHTLYWGDGTSQTTLNLVTYQKDYDFASLSGAVYVDEYGRNYKQVIVDLQCAGTCTTVLWDRATAGLQYPTGWLDVACAVEDVQSFYVAQQRKSPWLQRLRFIDSDILNTNSVYQYLSDLRVLDFNQDSWRTSLGNYQSTFIGLGNARKLDNAPIDLISNSTTQLNSTFQQSQLTEFGNITATAATTTNSTFSLNYNIERIGAVNLPATTSLTSFCNSCFNLFSIGQITTSSSLSSLNSSFVNCWRLTGVTISDCSGVSNTSNTFLNCRNLQNLILSGLTVGVSVVNANLGADAIDNFFTSLGTASGSQTVNVSGNVGAATCDTSIATSKGWTVVT